MTCEIWYLVHNTPTSETIHSNKQLYTCTTYYNCKIKFGKFNFDGICTYLILCTNKIKGY